VANIRWKRITERNRRQKEGRNSSDHYTFVRDGSSEERKQEKNDQWKERTKAKYGSDRYCGIGNCERRAVIRTQVCRNHWWLTPPSKRAGLKELKVKSYEDIEKLREARMEKRE